MIEKCIRLDFYVTQPNSFLIASSYTMTVISFLLYLKYTCTMHSIRVVYYTYIHSLYKTRAHMKISIIIWKYISVRYLESLARGGFNNSLFRRRLGRIFCRLKSLGKKWPHQKISTPIFIKINV